MKKNIYILLGIFSLMSCNTHSMFDIFQEDLIRQNQDIVFNINDDNLLSWVYDADTPLERAFTRGESIPQTPITFTYSLEDITKICKKKSGVARYIYQQALENSYDNTTIYALIQQIFSDRSMLAKIESENNPQMMENLKRSQDFYALLKNKQKNEFIQLYGQEKEDLFGEDEDFLTEKILSSQEKKMQEDIIKRKREIAYKNAYQKKQEIWKKYKYSKLMQIIDDSYFGIDEDCQMISEKKKKWGKYLPNIYAILVNRKLSPIAKVLLLVKEEVLSYGFSLSWYARKGHFVMIKNLLDLQFPEQFNNGVAYNNIGIKKVFDVYKSEILYVLEKAARYGCYETVVRILNIISIGYETEEFSDDLIKQGKINALQEAFENNKYNIAELITSCMYNGKKQQEECFSASPADDLVSQFEKVLQEESRVPNIMLADQANRSHYQKKQQKKQIQGNKGANNTQRSEELDLSSLRRTGKKRLRNNQEGLLEHENNTKKRKRK